MDPISEDLVKAAMMEELGKNRMDSLPMEDNKDRANRRGPPHHKPGPPHRGFGPTQRGSGPRQLAAIPHTPTRAPAGKGEVTNWQIAIASGEFQDEDAEAVKGLDDLGGGRVYANRDEMVRGETANMLSRMNPRALQNPEVYGPAAQVFRNRGQELPPGHRLGLNRSSSSQLGILLDPNVPLHTFPRQNKVQGATLVAPNGNITRVEPSRRGTPSAPQSNPQRQSRAMASPNVALTYHPSTRTPAPPQQAKPLSAKLSLFDQKRKDCVFEETVKYAKSGTSVSAKFVRAIVLLTPTDPPYMGYFILFVVKNEIRQLEHNMELNICRTVPDKNDQVVLWYKENELRESSLRLVFQTADKARDFLATLARLQNGGVDVKPKSPNSYIHLSAGKPAMIDKSSPSGTVARTGQASVPQAEENTKPVSAPTLPTQPKVEEAKPRPAAPVATQTSHRDNLPSKASPAQLAENGETGKSLAKPSAIRPASSDVVNQKVPTGQKAPVKAVAIKSAEPDLLSGPDLIHSDHVPVTAAPGTSGANNERMLIMDHNKENKIQYTSPTELLFDLTADSPPRAQTTMSSNMSLLLEVNPWGNDQLQLTGLSGATGEHEATADPWVVSPLPVSQDAVNETTQSLEQPQVQNEDDMERMRKSLDLMVLQFLTGFDLQGKAGKTAAEYDRTIFNIKQMVAETTRKMASEASYFGNLTAQQKQQTIDDFLTSAVVTAVDITREPTEAAAEPTEAAAAEDAVAEQGSPGSAGATVVGENGVAEHEGSPGSTGATAVDSSPTRVGRVEYSTQELMDIRPRAAQPPAWLGQLDFLPPAPVPAASASVAAETATVGKPPTPVSAPPAPTPMASAPPASVPASTPLTLATKPGKAATFTKSPTPTRPGSGAGRTLSMTPFGNVHNLVKRPAAPPTPVDSPSPVAAKPEPTVASVTESMKSLWPNPVKNEETAPQLAWPSAPPANASVNSPWGPAVKVEKTSPPLDGSYKSLWEPVKKAEKTTPSVMQPSAPADEPAKSLWQSAAMAEKAAPSINQPASLMGRSFGTVAVSPPLQMNEYQVQPKSQVHNADTKAEVQPRAPVGKTKEEVQQEFKAKVAGAAFELAERRRKEVLAVGGEHQANGQYTFSSDLNPQAAGFIPIGTDNQVGSAQETAPPAGGLRGLGNSRWASVTTTKLEKQGRFTGLGFEKDRRA